MLIFAFESSCDETAAAVVEMGEGVRKIRSSVVASQADIHRLYGGVVPEIASRAHIEAISGLAYTALEGAGVGIDEIGAVGVTNTPGLIGALLVGVNFAKSLAYANGLPLCAVNHIHAHAAAAYFTYPELAPPYLALIVSGGNTAFYHVRDYTDFEEIGSTRDDAAGEAFDKIGRVIGLGYPCGAEFDRLAGSFAGDKSDLIPFPSPALAGDNLDFSFSGLKTAAINYINKENQKNAVKSASPDSSTLPPNSSLAHSFTAAVVGGIAKKTAAALDKTRLKTLVVAGGVAANSHLRAALSELCAARGIALRIPPPALCADNAAMVGAQAYYEFIAGNLADLELDAVPFYG